MQGCCCRADSVGARPGVFAELICGLGGAFDMGGLGPGACLDRELESGSWGDNLSLVGAAPTVLREMLQPITHPANP